MTSIKQALKSVIKGKLGILRAHPYPEQFSEEMDLPEQAWAERFYLIASTGRSGSHFLGHSLIENGSLGVPLEYLNPGNAYYWKRRFGSSDLTHLFPHFVRHRTSPNGCFGFKAHWAQFKPLANQIDEMTRGRGIGNVIHIRRRNQLSQAVSHVIAQQTGAWISGATKRRTPHFDYDAIVKMATYMRAQNKGWVRYLNEHHPGQYMSVVFEDLLKKPDQTLGEIATYLDAEGTLDIPKRTQQQSSSVNNEWKERFNAEVKDEDAWILENGDN